MRELKDDMGKRKEASLLNPALRTTSKETKHDKERKDFSQ
jgi:hypothetical protein